MAGGTNFEGIDHAKLKAMVASSSPEKVLDRAGKLRAAGRLLEDLGKALNAHLGQIEWEGPAAESFKSWATNLNKSAVAIGEYSRNVGETMSQAGEVLSTVKSGIPAVPTADIAAVDKHGNQPAAVKVAGGAAGFVFGFGGGEAVADKVANAVNGDWVTDAEAQAAKKRVYAAHQEAIHQLEKLGQAYTAATAKLNSLQQPDLPKPPGSDQSREDMESVPVGPGGSGRGSGERYFTPPRGDRGLIEGHGPSGDGRNDDGGGGSIPGRPRIPGPDDNVKYPPPFHNVPPDTGGVVPGPKPTPLPWEGDQRPPGIDLNSLPPAPTVPGTPPTSNGNLPPLTPNGPGPVGPVGPGGGGQLPGPGPIGPNYIPGSGGGNNPSKSGTGGYNPGRSTGGPVFGAKEAGPNAAQTARGNGPMGGTGGMGPGMGGGGGSTGGSSRGRGLASTGGGVVGGAKGPTAGGAFTPGGSGLRSRAAGAGGGEAGGGGRAGQGNMMGAPMGGGAGRNEKERRERADYLHEDEETWTDGTPRSNPGVIE
ncbi:WXG100 family type VII secretion target [Kitasatospora sp. NPDC054939]